MERLIICILGLLLVIVIGGLIMWGIGNLIIYVFHINYDWTFLHGIVADLIFLMLKGIFKPDKE